MATVRRDTVGRHDEIPAGLSVSAVLVWLLRHPWRYVACRWNYKSAVTSSIVRGLLFFATNLPAGLGAALSALSTEFWLRFVTAGCYGALTQAFRRAEPAREAMLGALVVVPAVGHLCELAVHWVRGTANLQLSIGVSMLFNTAVDLVQPLRDAAGNLHGRRRQPDPRRRFAPDPGADGELRGDGRAVRLAHGTTGDRATRKVVRP